ncbi:hypothetical protein L0F63_002418 [Massospora cicadina]|nr:hypothetical protein L0F63_002418 [Massospora cicadina]
MDLNREDELRVDMHNRLFCLLDQTPGTSSCALLDFRQTLADYMATCFDPSNLRLFGEDANLFDLKVFLLFVKRHAFALFDGKRHRPGPPDQPSPINIDVDPEASLDNEVAMGLGGGAANLPSNGNSLAGFPLSELPKVGHNELVALKYLLVVLTAAGGHSKRLQDGAVGTLVTLEDIVFLLAPFTTLKNFVCHMLASLLGTSASLAREAFPQPNWRPMVEGEFLAAYDRVANALGVVPDNLSIYKVDIQPRLASREEAFEYFLKLALTLVRIIRSNHHVLSGAPNLIFEALFEVFFASFDPFCLELCSDLMRLSSFKALPSPLQLEYALGILHTICNYLNLINEPSDSVPGAEGSYIKLETALARILWDIIDVLPTSAHALIRSHKAFETAILLLREICPFTVDLLVRALSRVFARVLNDGLLSANQGLADCNLETILGSFQYATPRSHSLLLTYAANALALFPSHIAYAVPYQGHRAELGSFSVASTRRRLIPKVYVFGAAAMLPWPLRAVVVEGEKVPERCKGEGLDGGESLDPLNSLNTHTKHLIAIRKSGNSGQEFSHAIFSHLACQALAFFGPLHSRKVSSLETILSIFEVGIRLLPKECHPQMHQILTHLLEPMFDLLAHGLVSVSETFYRQLGCMAALFSCSAGSLLTYGSPTCQCYESMFQLFALVWRDEIFATSLSDLEAIFEKSELAKLLTAAKEDGALLFKREGTKGLKADFGMAALSLSGMVVLLPHSEADYDVYYAFLLAALLSSLRPSSSVALQVHAWKIMPKAFACTTFFTYFAQSNLERLLGVMYKRGELTDELQAAFIANFGKLICSISGSCSFVELDPSQYFPVDEVFCYHCDRDARLRYQSASRCEASRAKAPSPKPLEQFPVEALNYLLGVIKSKVTTHLRAAASLSLCRALMHLPLKGYSELTDAIPELCPTLYSEHPDLRHIARTTLLNVVSFDESDTKKIFSIKLAEHLFETVKGDASGFMVDTILSFLTELAKRASPYVLNLIVCSLTEYLYHNDRRMSASIFTKLHDIATAHKIRLKTLFYPVWENFTAHIINDLKTKGYFIVNLAMALQANVNLPHVIPKLVMDQDFETLKRLAELLDEDLDLPTDAEDPHAFEEQRVVQMCTSHLHYIVASLFMLPESRRKAPLDFFMQLATKSNSFRSDKMVESCSEEMILNLVIELGRVDTDRMNEPLTALVGVARCLLKNKGLQSDADYIQQLLVKRLMYLFSSFNSFLSEYRYPQDYMRLVKVLRALDILILLVNKHVKIFLPQILSAVKIAISFPFLASLGVKICCSIVEGLDYELCKPFVNQILAMLSECYLSLDDQDRSSAVGLFREIYTQSFKRGNFRVISLPESIAEFEPLNTALEAKTSDLGLTTRAEQLLETIKTENVSVCIRALKDLYAFLTERRERLLTWTLEEPINPVIDETITSLVAVCKKFAENDNRELQYNAMLCFGTLGAVDPDRLSPRRLEAPSVTQFLPYKKNSYILVASELIEKHLAKLYASTVVVKDQFFVAYAIQELMAFCDFNVSNTTSNYDNEILPFSREVWDKLPDAVVEMIRPLMVSSYRVSSNPASDFKRPIFNASLSFEGWVCRWTTSLIQEVIGDHAHGLFSPCWHAADKYVEVAAFLLPHLILVVVLQGNDSVDSIILQEIRAVLDSSATQPNGTLLSKASQLIFSLHTYLSNWCSRAREIYFSKPCPNHTPREQEKLSAAYKLCRRFIQRVPKRLLAQAAHKTLNYEHAVFYLEAHLRELRAKPEADFEKQQHDIHTQLHDLYFQLDDIDGLQGVQSLFLVGDAQQQLREHEASKNWPAAQTCYEVLANAGFDPKACQHGITSCMKNMGSLDLATNHLAGLAVQLPSIDLTDELQLALDEASWRLGKWDRILDEPATAPMSIDRSLSHLLLAASRQDSDQFLLHLEATRKQLLSEFSNHIHSYTRGYDSLVWLHMLDDAEAFHKAWTSPGEAGPLAVLSDSEASWDARLLATSPSFKVREKDKDLESKVNELRTRSFIQCARFARKAGYNQTSYRSLLENIQCDTPIVAMEMAKWHWSQGQPWKAVEILLKLLGSSAPGLAPKHGRLDTLQFCECMEQSQVRLKLVKWMIAMSACNQEVLLQEFHKIGKAQPGWEKGHFHAAQFHLSLLTHEASSASASNVVDTAIARLEEIVTSGHSCLKLSPKYVYQLLPRILTQWLHCNVVFRRSAKKLVTANGGMFAMAKELPVYMFLPVFSQVVSRLNYDGAEVSNVLNAILYRIMVAYPHQALWALVGTSVSSDEVRRSRYVTLLSKLKTTSHSVATVAVELEYFCSQLREIAGKANVTDLDNTIARFLPKYGGNLPLSILMPTQTALAFSLPSAINLQHCSHFTPYPTNLVTINRILPGVKIMPSLMKPRQLSFLGSDLVPYKFLCKPKDDLRKDSRLIELFHFLNRMFRQDPEARRRQLYIRTFAVVPLDHQCGLVEWVDNVEPLRACIISTYNNLNLQVMTFDNVKQLLLPKVYPQRDKRIELFETQILPSFPPVLSQWLVSRFPHPSRWLVARSAYAHTLAVMSMVGFVVGLGDRHGENILMDGTCGDVVHVDFSSLFEVGLELEIPEVVPFRLTRNMVDALGVSGYEGAFRRSCEVTLSVLRANRETLKALLETFLHDPLADFLGTKRSKILETPVMASRRHFVEGIKRNPPFKNLDANAPLNNPNILWALKRIADKLDGRASSVFPAPLGTHSQPISVEGQALQLLQSATDSENLFCMYIGWGPYY